MPPVLRIIVSIIILWSIISFFRKLLAGATGGQQARTHPTRQRPRPAQASRPREISAEDIEDLLEGRAFPPAEDPAPQAESSPRPVSPAPASHRDPVTRSQPETATPAPASGARAPVSHAVLAQVQAVAQPASIPVRRPAAPGGPPPHPPTLHLPKGLSPLQQAVVFAEILGKPGGRTFE